MTANITKVILNILSDNHWSLDFKQLDEKLRARESFSVSDLRSALFDDGRITIREGRRQKQAGHGQLLSPDALVVVKTNLRLCQRKSGECVHCESLHLCRYYVSGSCTFGHTCKNSHSLATEHNAKLLKIHGLEDLKEKELFQLLLQNDPYLLPEVCSHYNMGNGPSGACKFTQGCKKLHVCKHHLQGDCKFGSSCKRAHMLDAQGLKLLQMNQEHLKNLHIIYRNKLIIAGQHQTSTPGHTLVHFGAAKPFHAPSPKAAVVSSGASTVSDAERNEICLFFLRQHCSFKEKCARVHWHLPYRWQVLDSDGKTWSDLGDMEEVEKAYCDPARDTSGTNKQSPKQYVFELFASLGLQSPDKSVDFENMTMGQSSVRRLSTASSVTKPPHFILTTQWLWYWRDEHGLWQEYGKGGGTTGLTSESLENMYMAGRDANIPFQAGQHQYVLHFKDPSGSQTMFQQNLKFQTKREVRRRPRFMSAEDVKMLLSSGSSNLTSSSTSENLPSNWDKTALPQFGFKLVNLGTSMEDYKQIEKLFKSTMPGSKVSSIQRIQNPSLWRVFQWQKEQMQKRSGGKLVDQRYLFHGTDESLIDPICDQNFDWRVCGSHGTAYGKGSYFAKDASYSDRYTRAGYCSDKIMFVALVLVGEYTNGSSSLVRPPPKKGSNTLYDSCVNDVRNPTIFVVFEKMQIYPEYIIRYR